MKTLFLFLVAVVVAVAAIVWLGVPDVAADTREPAVVREFLAAVRRRSVEVRARSLVEPNLAAPDLLRIGAGHYAGMCADCHRAPGMTVSGPRPVLSPEPPDLTKTRVDPRAAFWIVKHGIRMSGMPAWGTTHDDREIWAIVAFVEKLPAMTPAEYRAAVAAAPREEMEP